MREILFKAKRKDNGEWVEGFLFKLFYDKMWCIGNEPLQPNDYSEIIGQNRDWFEIIPETICQYTGLKDKNGKEIYENDIVGFYWQDKCSCGLVGYGAFNCTCCDGVYGWHFGEEDIREHYDYEVIGNIFDNPELLEGGAE